MFCEKYLYQSVSSFSNRTASNRSIRTEVIQVRLFATANIVSADEGGKPLQRQERTILHMKARPEGAKRRKTASPPSMLLT